MLHTENRQSGSKGIYSVVISSVLFLVLATGCNNGSNRDSKIGVEAFSDLKTPAFILDVSSIHKELCSLADPKQNATVADSRTQQYYADKDSCELLWFRRYGLDSGADSLLAWLHIVNEEGLSADAFHVKDIEADMNRFRALDFDDKENTINHVVARLEYNLTRACLRYTYGQRFGFVNPYRAYNHFDVEKADSTGRVIKFRGLYDVAIDQPSNDYDKEVFSKIKHDSIASYLREIQPQGKLYKQLKGMLANTDSADVRKRIICNMERCRWRLHQPIQEQGKRIVVNIPAFHLYAYNGSGLLPELDMKIVCGAVTTKSPQLSSNIEWMEINPQWVIPMSIIKNEVAHHAGDSNYFNRHRYNIYDRNTNSILSGSQVTRSMLLSGKYRVAQKGGAGNSLGRIVFRFKNSFAVYLHDTSNPSAFNREVRAMSHGCIRVSKPFDLSQFVLDNPDEWLSDRIRIAMGQPAQTERGIKYVKNHTDEEVKKLISRVDVKPSVPVHILYYTMWYDETGTLQNWNDVYGFDKLLWKHLQPYMP